MIESEGVTVEVVRAIQKSWDNAVIKSKMALKKMHRREFDKLLFTKRHEFLKNGGKVFD